MRTLRSSDQHLIHLHWALVVSLVYLTVFGRTAPGVPWTHVTYAGAALVAGIVLSMPTLRRRGNMGATLVAFDTVLALAGLALNASTSQDFLIGFFVCIVVASFGDSPVKLAGAAIMVAGAYAVWMMRGVDVLHSAPMLLRLPFLFIATAFYGAVMQRERGDSQYRQLFEASPRPMWVYDVKTLAFLAVNQAAVKLYGFSEAEFLSMTSKEIRPPAEVPKLLEAIAKLDLGLMSTGEFRHWKKDGTLIDTEVLAEPMIFQGRRARLVVITDVTAQRRAARELEESLSLLRSTIESTADGLLVVDQQGKFTLYNRRFVEMWNMPKALLAKGDDEAALRFVVDQLESPEEFVTRAHEIYSRIDAESFDVLRFRDGRIFERFSRPQRIDGQTVGRVWSFRDVTARVRAEEGARASGEQYRDLFEGVPLGAYRTTPEGRFEDANFALVLMLGYPDRETLLRRPVGELYATPDDRSRLRTLLEREGSARGFEVQFLRFDGSILDAAVSARVVRDDGGRVRGYEGMIEDIRDRVRSERALKEALRKAEESDRLKSAFLANMSHEIRTPLNIILGYGEMIHEGADGTPGGRSTLLDAVRRASGRLLNTVHGVLDLAKLQSGSFDSQPTNLRPAQAIEDQLQVFAAAAAAKGIVIRREIEEPDALVRFDEYCLNQGLRNLLDNAVKFTSKGEIVIRLCRDGEGALVLEVRDSGIGIGEEYLPRLFDPFNQEHTGGARPFEGSGIGLAVAKGLLELNGAELGVSSEKDKGSTFRVRFDRARDVTIGAPRRRLRTFEERVKPLLLIVEDDEDSLLYVQAILGKRYTLLKARNATEAHAALAERGREIRLVLMDIALKGAEDGVDLTRSIRTHPNCRHVPVIATTAHALQEFRQRVTEAGGSAFLAKPFTPKQLTSLVEEFLQRSSAAAA